jgi:hypothetical protein
VPGIICKPKASECTITKIEYFLNMSVVQILLTCVGEMKKGSSKEFESKTVAFCIEADDF